MVQGIFKNGEAIETTYQAKNAATGKTIQMDVYDETHTKDDGQSGTMTEIGTTGRYYKSFTPDAEGVWTIEMFDSVSSAGNAVKTYLVTGHNLDSIGDALAALNDLSSSDVETAVGTAIADLPTNTEMGADHDELELAIRGADSDTLETLSDQLDDIAEPPMVG